MDSQQSPAPGTLSWRLSSHPITLLTFLVFRSSSLLVYLFGLLFTKNLVLVFIITILLLAADFYYLKNIAGRRLVGLRWWNEVDPQTGDSKWVFESSEPGTKVINATDSRFFWLANYVQPLLWVALAILALVRFMFIWLPLVGIAMALTITNSLAFSRCDKFSQASNIAGGAFSATGLAGNIASGMVGRLFGR
ncbi:hypothetical protein VPNG_05296 [Cytospora leucostoma]|uniref:Golgi apparatus membrane protein TVP23 n=1 Tax=Cytospora leucostoma TaxID=1230097 RepID=A0A423X4T1_9PEZI|nr:hypothetical protein VPNG_05296 [Cytospora leucostoma]